jgi:hypothetical protein
VGGLLDSFVSPRSPDQNSLTNELFLNPVFESAPLGQKENPMNRFTARLNRLSRFTVTSLTLLVLALSVALAEGWGDVGGPPTSTRVAVNSYHVLYADGSELLANGTYTTGGVSYSMPAATYDGYGDLCYSEGTTLFPDGSWETIPIP